MPSYTANKRTMSRNSSRNVAISPGCVFLFTAISVGWAGYTYRNVRSECHYTCNEKTRTRHGLHGCPCLVETVLVKGYLLKPKVVWIIYESLDGINRLQCHVDQSARTLLLFKHQWSIEMEGFFRVGSFLANSCFPDTGLFDLISQSLIMKLGK